MSNAFYLKWGKCLFAAAMIAIGVVHLTTRNFPTGLEPVPAIASVRQILVYLTGAALLLGGLLLLIEKFAKYGAMLVGGVWLLLLLLLDLPLLIFDLHNPGPWTVTFETVGLLSGAIFLLGDYKPDGKADVYKLIGRYLFLSSLVVFAIQHYIYVKFIGTLIPAWLPAHLFWAWLVTIAFIAASVSIIIHVKVRLTALLLSLMFLIWVIILHIPRAVSGSLEAEWTSTFVALAMAGVSLLLAATTAEEPKT